MRHMPQILLVKTSSMGDVIHNLPVIADIRTHYPTASFDWMVEESFAEIPQLHPHVREVIPVAIRRWRKSIFSSNTWGEIRQLKQHLKNTRYDAIIDTQGLLKSAIAAQLAHGETFGMDYHSAREPIASLFYKHTFDIPRNQHAVNRNRALAALSLNYQIPESAPDYGLDSVAQRIKLEDTFTLPSRYAVFLHGTSRDSKLWPTSHWIALAEQLAKYDLKILLPWSNPAEESRARTIAANASNAIVLPKLRLTPIAAILANAELNIGVDTGLMHLSTALDKPSIAIYTDTDPVFTGVRPGVKNLAVNIGGKNQMPSANSVLQLALRFINKD